MAYILRRRRLGAGSCRGITAASQTGLIYANNYDPLPAGHELVIRWGCTSEVGVRDVLNTSKAIHLVSNKTEFRKLLEVGKLCSPSWFSLEDFARDCEYVDGDVMFPCIVRPETHAQGRNLHVCNNIAELKVALNKCRNPYINKLINKVVEYRIFVIQGRVGWVAQKTPGNPEDVAWNVARGGRFDNVRFDDWPLRSIKVAIEAMALSGLDFGGVDVMEDANGKPYVLEINSAPSHTSEYRMSCTAKCFDHVIKFGKATIPLIKEKGKYLKFIHPAIDAKAKLL